MKRTDSEKLKISSIYPLLSCGSWVSREKKQIKKIKKFYSNNVWKHVIMIQRKFACSKPTKETGLWNRLKVNNKSTTTTTMAPFSSISIVDLEQVNVSWSNMFNVKTSSRGVKISVKYLWWRFYQIYPPKRNFLSKTEKTNINI